MKENKIWVRHCYLTDEPIAVAKSYDELESKKSSFVDKKPQGKDKNTIYIREYIETCDEDEKQEDEKQTNNYNYCPYCGENIKD